jgi:hypothetical protein
MIEADEACAIPWTSSNGLTMRSGMIVPMARERASARGRERLVM